MNEILPYRVLEDCESLAEEEDVQLHMDLILAAVENRLEPAHAARQITNTIVEHAAAVKARIDSSGTNKPYDDFTSALGMAITSIASSCPPQHATQERVFQLLHAFDSLGPVGEVPNQLVRPNGEFDGDPDDPVLDSRLLVPLWEGLGRLNLEVNCQWLADLGQQWSGIEKRDSEEQYRWRNMSYFFARLSTEGKADLDWLSALRFLEPERRIPHDVPGWSGFLAGQVLAAAQWILPQGHGAWVRRKCLEPGPTVEGGIAGRHRLGLERWGIWKAAFVELAALTDDARVSKEAIQDARKAVEVMGHLEFGS